jgi:uncharacterized protein YjbI with pentapeptide repeats
MTSPGHGAAPPLTKRVAGRPAYPGRLTVRPPAPPSKRERFARSFAKAFYWQGWKTVGAVAASLVAICTAIVAIATFTVSVRTLQANTRSQTSDRFVKATEQLGNDKSPDIRIGGIYGLEQLARDTPSDHRAVFDVLTAFVRHEVPARSGKCTDPNLQLKLPDGTPNPNASPSADVQAAVDAIARRDRQNDRSDQVIDLSNTCLVASEWLQGIQLPGVEMSRADLRSASLFNADLDGADLFEANLTGTRLMGTNFTKAVLQDADLTEAYLLEANLTEANLIKANLTRAYLCDGGYEANLTGAVLNEANLTEAHLHGANLTDAALGNGSNLTKADLTDANLTRAILQFDNLSGANLMAANLTGADLSGVDLTGANLTRANLSDIYYDGSTTWPNGFRPPPSSQAPAWTRRPKLH